VRRLLAIVVHNWPLKLAAVGLAMLLYVGLVLAQNSKEWRGQVAIDVRNQPAGVVIPPGIQYVTSIRYFAPNDLVGGVTDASFSAWVDLSNINPDQATDVTVPVTVTSPDVRVLDWAPRQVSIRIDPLRSKVVPVQVDKGVVPEGLEVREPVVDPGQVTVSGTQSSVSRVVAALARVRIDPAGLTIDQQVDLIGVDARNVEVPQIHIEPSSVRVKILVGSQLQSRNLPVSVAVTGTPGAGYEIGPVRVEPGIVAVEGDADVLAALTTIDTQPVSISGAVGDISATVALVLPSGVESLVGESVRVTIAISPTTSTRTFSVGVVLAGARSDRVYVPSTDQVLITVGGESAALAALKGDTLFATADVDGLAPGTHQVNLKVSLPAGLSLVSVNPAKISVTISEPPPASPSASSSAAP
jgi:YbbR domain-containing protein